LKQELDLTKGRLELAMHPTVYPTPALDKPKTKKEEVSKADRMT